MTEDYKALALKVNNYWQQEYPEPGDCAWEKSCYMMGNIAAYELTGNKKYLEYALRWANKNKWRFYEHGWHYSVGYGYTLEGANNYLCGESYLRLKDISGEGTDEHIRRTMECVLKDKRSDYWWWIDAVYMALPLFHIMGKRYKDSRYYEKAHRLFNDIRAVRGLYDEKEHLWYRDVRFISDNMLSDSGTKVFWGRGNGWVFGGLARTLDIIDETDPYYGEYKEVFCDMAKKLRSLARPGGGFTTGLLNPEEFPESETSATALITHALLIGVRKGILGKEYFETAKQGFEWLTKNALLENGKIGYVQGISWGPEMNWELYGDEEKKQSSKDYAVGSYLMILKEMYLAEKV